MRSVPATDDPGTLNSPSHPQMARHRMLLGIRCSGTKCTATKSSRCARLWLLPASRTRARGWSATFGRTRRSILSPTRTDRTSPRGAGRRSASQTESLPRVVRFPCEMPKVHDRYAPLPCHPLCDPSVPYTQIPHQGDVRLKLTTFHDTL